MKQAREEGSGEKGRRRDSEAGMAAARPHERSQRGAANNGSQCFKAHCYDIQPPCLGWVPLMDGGRLCTFPGSLE